MISIRKVLVLTAAAISRAASGSPGDTAPTLNVGAGIGLNPLCIVMSTENFACSAQGSALLTAPQLHAFAKVDGSSIFLWERKVKETPSDGSETAWGPRRLALSSWLVGGQIALGGGDRWTAGIGAGRFRGSSTVSIAQRYAAESPRELRDEVTSLKGSTLHSHVAFKILSTNLGHLSVLVNWDAYLFDRPSDAVFATKHVIAMPTPQVFWSFGI